MSYNAAVSAMPYFSRSANCRVAFDRTTLPPAAWQPAQVVAKIAGGSLGATARAGCGDEERARERRVVAARVVTICRNRGVIGVGGRWWWVGRDCDGREDGGLMSVLG